MEWFKNLNARPRLMFSFGVLMVLSVVVSCLAIYNLSAANQRVETLYQKQVMGIIYIENLSSARLDLTKQDRDAMIKMDDPESVKKDIAALKADFQAMYSNLKDADQCYFTPEGKAILNEIRETLPPYEQDVMAFVSAVEDKDMARAKLKLYALAPAAAKIGGQIDRAINLKQKAAETAYMENNASYQTARTLLILSCLISLASGVFLSLLIAKSFSEPLAQAVAALERVADGDLTASLEVNTRDEMGRMAGALNNALDKLNATMIEVAENAAAASSSSQELAAASEAIASGAQQQAASLEETSASLEEITAAVRQSADNAQQAAQLAASSKESAQQGQEVVSTAVTAMAEINAASAKISDIISTIDEIAFQTNLLAVNAAVEAARAGEEGRGFAVVASEVRSLAQRSAVAAKEIKVLIQDSLRKVSAGSDLVNHSGQTLQGIVGSVKRVTDIVGEIAAASGEQSTGIEQVNTAMTQMDQVTQSNSAQTEELSATAQNLSEQAAHLMELMTAFTLTGGNKLQREKPAARAPLVASVKPPAPQAPLARRVVKASKSATGRSEPRNRRVKDAPIPVALTATPATASASDASFEEF